MIKKMKKLLKESNKCLEKKMIIDQNLPGVGDGNYYNIHSDY